MRVVILGQDPYHAAGQAEGLAFSVPVGQRVPPSLRNVFRELQRDLGLPTPPSGHLGSWARQGVLLLNTCLTVEEGQPAGHAGQGWEALTDSLIQCLVQDDAPKVFLLWGRHAQTQARVIATRPGHGLLLSNHPSPLSATRDPQPFLGNGHFSAANRFLAAHGLSADRLADRLKVQRWRGPAQRRDMHGVLYSAVRRGGVPEWLKGADCKSVGLRLRWFESSLLHQARTWVLRV